MGRGLSVVGAPSSAGAYAPGQEKAPATWRRHGLLEALAAAGRPVRDRGDVVGFRWRADPDRQDAMNADAVARVARGVADAVGEALDDGDDVLVLGGDCTVELETMTGALRRGGRVALVYIDLDADLTVPATAEGAVDWMGVAHLLDVEGCLDELAALGPRRPMLTGADVLLLAQDNITEPEAAIVSAEGIRVEPLLAVHRDPEATARRVVEWASGHDELWVHVDIDVLSWAHFPIAENSRRADGLRLDELAAVLRVLVAAPGWRGLTICEVNPDHAPDEAESFARLVGTLGEVFGAVS